jgi:Protein of unknown function (DUF2690)
MGRPERSVDVESGPVARLAYDLRALRQAAGAPSYRTLTARANYSATVLSRAASGRELPSLPVLLAYVTACGGDRAEWETRWQEVSDQLEGALEARRGPDAGSAETGSADTAEGGAEAAAPGAGHSRRTAVVARVIGSRRRALALALTVAAVSGWATALAVLASPGGGAPAARTSGHGAVSDVKPAAAIPTASVGDGSDPVESGCTAGAVTVAHSAVRLATAAIIAGTHRPAGTAVGLVELRYSPRCHAAWVRATPSNGYNVASLGSVTVTITRPGDGTYSSFRVEEMTLVYGDLMLTTGGCLTAAAEFRFAAGGRAAALTPCAVGK